MIGVLTLALLGGFGALLLEQKPKTTTAALPASQTAPTAAIPASPGTVPPPTSDPTSTRNPDVATQNPAQTPAASSTPAGQQPTSATQPPVAQTATNQTPTSPTQTSQTPASQTSVSPAPGTAATPPVESTSQIPPVPAAPPVQAITPPVLPEKAPAQTTSQAPEASQTAETEAPKPATTAVPARSGGAVPALADRTPLRSEYRISLGSFATSKTVETQTSAVSGLGYRVHSIDLGNQYVAQVGPFADEETARQALADIQRAYPGALLYRPRNKAATSTSDSSTADSSAGSASENAANTSRNTRDAGSSAPAPDGPRYLQVGAFDRPESAQKLVGILRDHDFAPTVSSPPEGKTTVMVGPYSGGALLRAETRLNNAGLDHFRVR